MKRAFLLLPLAAALPFAAHAQSLQEAMRSALESHPEIHAGVHARLAAEAELSAAKGGYLPRIDAVGGYGREGTDNPSGRADGEHDYETLTRSEASLNLEQMLFDGFATSSEVKRNRAVVNSRALELLGNSERTALEVAQVYLDVLRRQALVRLAEENLRSHERIFDQISLRSQRGVGRMADLDQAEARLAQARNNLLTEQTNLDDARINFISVVGEPPQGLAAPAPVVAELPESFEQARDKMLAGNPQLRSAEADVNAAEAQVAAAKSAFYPRFALELSTGANNNIDGVRGHENEWQAMVRMRYNLFAGGSNKAELLARSYQANQALDIRNNALRLLTEELGLAWNALSNARQQLPVAQEYVDRSARVRDSYQQQFTLGERTLLDLLDSENELFTAARRLEDVRFTEALTQYRIKAVTGSLLQSQGVAAPLAAVPMDEVQARVALPSMN
ncbi:TolC family outer membrane protein [Stutzerimonas urumqiensis]|uniref:TolC family outer membrane protein n=1 Tax=Stutzerimonas urumqiensis TaxID=638269 RepID=UPI003BA9A17A